MRNKEKPKRIPQPEMIEMCACGGKCEGLCRENRLNRKRGWAEHCPEHYLVPKKGS